MHYIISRIKQSLKLLAVLKGCASLQQFYILYYGKLFLLILLIIKLFPKELLLY